MMLFTTAAGDVIDLHQLDQAHGICYECGVVEIPHDFAACCRPAPRRPSYLRPVPDPPEEA